MASEASHWLFLEPGAANMPASDNTKLVLPWPSQFVQFSQTNGSSYVARLGYQFST